jgi:biopolymer transport protein ExbD
MGLRKPSALQIGLAFVLIGVSQFGGCKWWLDTRIWVPLDIPISLRRGHVRTPEFWTNVDSSYVVLIEVDRKSDFDRVLCFLGRDSPDCKDSQSLLRASWSVSNSGRIVARGSSEDRGGWVNDAGAIDRELGSFAVEKGKHYVLDLEMEQDASRLDADNPRLKAAEHGARYESATSNASFVFLFSALLVLLGTGMLVRFALRWRREQNAKTISLAFPGPKLSDLYFDPDFARVRYEPTRARRPLSAWLGCSLIVTGVIAYAGVQRWMSTRTFEVVNMPVSLVAGHIRTGPFTTNLEAQYEIWIDIDRGQQFRATCGSYLVLQTNWKIYHDGRVAGPGYQDFTHGTYLGVFDTKKGTYDLDIEVLQDASCLNPGHPRVTVRARKEEYADDISILLWLAAVTVVAGTSLMLLPSIEYHGKKSTLRLCLSDFETIGQNFQWAQKLPLKRKFSGIPSFGLVAALVYFVVVIAVWVVSSSPRSSMGLPLQVLKPGVTPAKSDPWTELLIVRIEDQGAGVEANLYVNSKKVTWEDLGDTMKEELARRPPGDRIVYLEGDPNIAWADPLNVIDIVQGAGGKVILLTPKSTKL